MADLMTPERRARLLADAARLRDLTDTQRTGSLTIPDRRDMEALARLVKDIPDLAAECAESARIRTDLEEKLAAQGTVTEYGVLAWSKHLGKRHVDACDDYATALSTLRTMWRKVDAGAQLVSRQVPAPGPVGKWLPVSPDDAAAALETAMAATR